MPSEKFGNTLDDEVYDIGTGSTVLAHMPYILL